MRSNDDICVEALVELFKRVGLEYPDKEFTAQDDWYLKKTWTKEQEDDYRKWLHKLMKKHMKYYSKRKRDDEVGLFMVCYGWKIEA